MCIGNRFAMLELKTALAHLVRKFHFRFDESKPIEPFSRLSLAPVTGVHVFPSLRQHQQN